MAGRPNSWDAIAATMPGSPRAEDVREKLDALVSRRNAIAHEGDYERLDRPQQIRVVKVAPSEARAAVKFISELVEAIHDAAG